MELSRDQRRAFLAMCCLVARADGHVTSGEYEGVLDLLARLGHGAVGFSELQGWLDQGPPPFDARLPEQHVRGFLREALTVARADGKLDDVELGTIKGLVQRFFDLPRE